MSIPAAYLAPSAILPFQARLVDAIQLAELDQVTGCLSSLSLASFDDDQEPNFWPEAQACMDLAESVLPHDDIGCDQHSVCISDAFLEEWEDAQEHSFMAMDDEWLSMTRLLAQ